MREAGPNRGFTLIEVVIAVGIMALLLTGGVTLAYQHINSSREDETLAKLMMFRRALIGDPRIVTKESRTDFGLLGDMGSLPSSLNALWIKGLLSSYSFDTTLKVGTGWTGPYFLIGPLKYFNDIPLDAWGNPIQYELATGTSAATGQEYRARLISYGADAGPGGGDDLTTEIYKTEILSKIVGYIRDSSGNPLPGVSVRIHYPVNGTVTNSEIQTDTVGSYTFSDIPFGNRSLRIDPRLVYMFGTGVSIPTGGIASDVEFTVQNFNSSDVTITNLKADFDVTAFYETLLLNATIVYNNASARVASGQTVTFSPYTVLGIGAVSGSTSPIRIQSPFTQIPDLSVGSSASRGGSLRVTMRNFKAAQSGVAASVDMTGVSFTVTFSDGSVAIFTTERRS